MLLSNEAPFVDLAACQLDVCGLVHDDGWVACTGTDALFAAAQLGVHHAHAGRCAALAAAGAVTAAAAAFEQPAQPSFAVTAA